MPAWVNLFRKDDLPPTIIMDSRDGAAVKTVEQDAKGVSTVTISFTLDYPYGGFPQDMVVRFFPTYDQKRPFVSMTWLTPDGRQLDLGSFAVVTGQRYVATQHIPDKYLSAEVRKKQSLRGRGGLPAAAILFADPAAAEPVPLKGTYTLRLDGLTFEAGGDLDAEVVFDGQVYGLAGTDDVRRDLLVGLLWGMPVALAFGLMGAVATSLASMIIAAVGSWFGGWVDDLVQRVTEINMILPALPIAITVYYVYSKSIWVILGVMVLLSIFGSAVKNYRAIFVQVKEAPYVEAAQAYGASNGRIILRYLVPRIMPLLIPQLVILIPTYVFFEATLAYLGRERPAYPDLGQDRLRCDHQRRLRGILLLGAGADRPDDADRPGLCHGRLCPGQHTEPPTAQPLTAPLDLAGFSPAPVRAGSSGKSVRPAEAQTALYSCWAVRYVSGTPHSRCQRFLRPAGPEPGLERPNRGPVTEAGSQAGFSASRYPLLRPPGSGRPWAVPEVARTRFQRADLPCVLVHEA